MRYLICLLIVLFCATAIADTEWVLGLPVSSGTQNTEWVLGQPIAIENDPVVDGQGQIIMIGIF